MKILIIDNYDSFTYNIVDALRTLGTVPDVVRNDRLDLDAVDDYDKIIISPGPGIPSEAGQLPEFLKRYATRKPILGICLGHQAICKACGATVSYAKRLMHGKQSETVFSRECVLFGGCPDTAPVARYHSLAVLEETLPECLMVTARTQDGEIMAVQHRLNPVTVCSSIRNPFSHRTAKTMLTNFSFHKL